ncbi:hypothetical protein FACS189456_1090 [Bacteroidia bacterium]|nr:hypothetical protein FACS189456_1090 [Bacteroidia bacterium]
MKIIWIFFVLFILTALPNCRSTKRLAANKDTVQQGEITFDEVRTPQKSKLFQRKQTQELPQSEPTEEAEATPIEKPTEKPIERTIVVHDTVIIEVEVPVAMDDDATIRNETTANTTDAVNNAPRKPKTSSRKLKKEIATLKKQIDAMEKQQESLQDALRVTGAAFDEAGTTTTNIKVAPIFRVQISARKSKANAELAFSSFDLDGEDIFEEFYPDDPKGFQFKYVIGSFQQAEHAAKYCKFINRQGVINDAFVVAYYKGKRIPVKQATEIAERQK